jgi:Helix-turn-helix domain
MLVDNDSRPALDPVTPLLPDLVALRDLAMCWEIRTQRVYEFAAQADFPRPLAYVNRRSLRVFSLIECEDWYDVQAGKPERVVVVDLAELARRWGMSTACLRELASRDDFPGPIAGCPPGRPPMYNMAECRAWRRTVATHAGTTAPSAMVGISDLAVHWGMRVQEAYVVILRADCPKPLAKIGGGNFRIYDGPAVLRWAEECRVTPDRRATAPPRTERDEEDASIIQRYKGGETMREIADTIGRSKGTVRNLLIQAGVARRSRGGAHARRQLPAPD